MILGMILFVVWARLVYRQYQATELGLYGRMLSARNSKDKVIMRRISVERKQVDAKRRQRANKAKGWRCKKYRGYIL